MTEKRRWFEREFCEGAVRRVTLFVDDFDARVGAIAERGIEPALRETYGNGVRKATYRAPDGNEIGLGGHPVDVVT